MELSAFPYALGVSIVYDGLVKCPVALVAVHYHEPDGSPRTPVQWKIPMPALPPVPDDRNAARWADEAIKLVAKAMSIRYEQARQIQRQIENERADDRRGG